MWLLLIVAVVFLVALARKANLGCLPGCPGVLFGLADLFGGLYYVYGAVSQGASGILLLLAPALGEAMLAGAVKDSFRR